MNDFLDDTADTVERQYRAYLLQLTGVYAQVMDQPAPSSPAARMRFAGAAQQAQAMMLSQLADTIDRARATLQNTALSDAKAVLSDAQGENLVGLMQEARNALMGQVTLASFKDLDVVAGALREFALRVDQLMSVKGTTYLGAVIQARTQVGARFRFQQVDRGGRNWSSTNYARTLVRAFLVKTYVESYLYGRTAAGDDLAIVTHPEVEHDHHGMLFSITGATAGMPSYVEIKDAVWHPNSRAGLAH